MGLYFKERASTEKIDKNLFYSAEARVQKIVMHLSTGCQQ